MGDFYWYSLALIIFNFRLTKLFKTDKPAKYKNLPPSPPSIPIIGHLHLVKEPVHRTLQALSNKYGQILLLRCGSRTILLVSSPSAADECFTKNDVVFANRPRTQVGKLLHYNYSTEAVAPYGDLWRNHRRIMTLEIFSSSRLAMFSSVREGEIRLLLDQIVQSCNQGERKIELKSKFIELSFNVMMMIAGKRYFGEDAGDAKEAKKIRAVMRETVDLSGAANTGDFLPILQWVDFFWNEEEVYGVIKKDG
ncbi:cytochrome P450 81Q32 [Ziziphus jujuba]|uniref:Cytochrome P450 81Q32 n=1 Tax=Ziziphus jujuba TaxID=326968 RepID=A0ABM3ILP2_ZIZJJ|nr:cytochrome P450 81Q32 [Ziziphus jujuba]